MFQRRTFFSAFRKMTKSSSLPDEQTGGGQTNNLTSFITSCLWLLERRTKALLVGRSVNFSHADVPRFSKCQEHIAQCRTKATEVHQHKKAGKFSTQSEDTKSSCATAVFCSLFVWSSQFMSTLNPNVKCDRTQSEKRQNSSTPLWQSIKYLWMNTLCAIDRLSMQITPKQICRNYYSPTRVRIDQAYTV